jgi:lipopolysaccharide transport system permease protein
MRSTVKYTSARWWTAGSSTNRTIALGRELVFDLAIAASAYSVALYARQQIPVGRTVQTAGWGAPAAYAVMGLALLAAYVLRAALQSTSNRRPAEHLLTLVMAAVLAGAALTVFLAPRATLADIYFVLVTALLGVLFIPFRDDRERVERVPPLTVNLARLWKNGALIRIWVQYTIHSRYSQAVLGVAWVVLLPLFTALIMAVVFSHLMKVHTGGAPYIAFYLAAAVPFSLFSQSILFGMRSIMQALGLINQIYFPREILVVSALGEALVDAFFMFVAMLVIDAVVGVYPRWTYLVLPVLIVIQVSFTLGLMLITSWLGVLIRDVQQLISVILQILFYLSPIIYPVDIVPQSYRFLVTMNPIGVLIDAYRAVLVYGTVPNWPTLMYPAALGVALLVFGYRHFKANEDTFADMV